MEHSAAIAGIRFRPRLYGDGLACEPDAMHAVRVEHCQLHFVFGVGIEIDDAAREHVGADNVESHVAQNALAVQSERLGTVAERF